jgi:hypothetical protein
MVKTTVQIPEDLYLLARHYGLKNLGEFVRDALQGFVDGQEEPVADTVAMRARQIAVNLRIKSLEQRKLIQDAELERELREEASRAQRSMIEQETRAAVQKMGFRREWIVDPPHMNFSHRRKELADLVSVACIADIQWKDIESIVRGAVIAS